MITPNLPRNSIIKANSLMQRLRGCSLYDLSLDSKKDAIKEYYPRVRGGPNGTQIDKLGEKQATAILFSVYESAQKLVSTDPRQTTYLTLKQLEKAVREKRDEDEIVDLKQTLCIQLEDQDTYDYEIEHEYFAYQDAEEFVPF